MTTDDFEFGPLGQPQTAELGGVTRKPGRKGDRAETAARREKVMFMSRAGMSQAEIAREIGADAGTVSNDLAYLAKQAMESYDKADGVALMADIMTDYLNVRTVLYQIMIDPAAKKADRVSASKGLMQCLSDFKGFLATAGILSQESTGGGKAEAVVGELFERLGRSADTTDLYELFNTLKPGAGT